MEDACRVSTFFGGQHAPVHRFGGRGRPERHVLALLIATVPAYSTMRQLRKLDEMESTQGT
jgi:hypothetical protein